MAERTSLSVGRKAKRKRHCAGNQQHASAAKKKLQEDDGNDSNENILNSVDTNEMDEKSRKKNRRGKASTGAGEKMEKSENEAVPSKEEDVSSVSKRRRRVRTKDSGTATVSRNSKDAVVDAAEEASDDKMDAAGVAIVINHKEETNVEEAVSGVDDLAVHGKSSAASNRKHGRLSLKRKEETDGPNVVEMLLKVKPEQGLKVKSGAAESSAKNGKCSDVSAPPVAPSLVNLGNTCFLSSVLQVFFYTPSFLENLTILSSEIGATEKDLARVADFDSKLEIACHSSHSWKLVRNLNELMQKMKKMEMLISGQQCQMPSPISPSDLLDTIQSMNSLFVVGQQQDSHELLRCLLAFIQEAVHQLNCCRTGLQALQTTDSPLVNGHGTSVACDEKKTIATHDTNACNGVGKNAKSRAEKETRNKKNTAEAKSSEKQPRKRSKLDLNEGSNKHTDRSHARMKGSSPQSSSNSETSGATGNHRNASLSPPTSFKSDSTGSKAFPGPAASNSSLTKSSIMSYFGAAVKPRSLDEIVLRTELVSDFVESLCQGTMEQQTRCLECEQVTRNVEDFQDLALPVKKGMKSRVRRSSSDSEDGGKDEDADYSWILKVVDEVERLDSENKFWCEVCVHHVEAERCIRYTGSPDVLTIQLKRFSAFSGFFSGFTKTMDCVGVPLHLPCLEHTCRLPTNKSNQHRYELYAILSHSGISLSSGHYITYIRAPPSAVHHHPCPCDVTSCPNVRCCKHSDETKEHKECTVWYECDDEVVTSLSQCQLVSMLASDSATTPYMLFYEKRHL